MRDVELHTVTRAPTAFASAGGAWLTVGYCLLVGIAFGLFAWIAARAFQQPLNQSGFDLYWLCGDLGISLLIGLLLWPQRGRWLLGFSLMALGALLAASFVRMQVALAWGVLLWVSALAWALGERALTLVAGEIDERRFERPVFAVAVGFGLLSVLIFILTAARWLYAPVVVGVLLALTALLGPMLLRLAARVVAAGPERLLQQFSARVDARLIAFVSAAGALALASGLVWALAPETRYDALNYQLGIPAIYVQNHGLVELPYSFWSYFMGSANMLYALALCLVGQPLPQLLHLLCGLLVAVLTGLCGARLHSLRVGLLSAAIFYTVPLVTWESGTAYIDLIVSLYAFGAIYAALAWRQGGRDGWLTIFSLMAGFAVATKLTAAVTLLPVAAIVGYGLFTRRRAGSVAIGFLLLRGALPAVIVVAPWFALRSVWTGNPVFPLLNALFRSPYWPAINEAFNLADYGRGSNLSALARLPWNLLAYSGRFAEGAPNGSLGLLPLLSLPLFLPFIERRHRRVVYELLILFLCGLLLWFKTGQAARFLLPLLPLAALLAAFNLDCLYQRLKPQRFFAAAAPVLAAIVGVSYLAGIGVVNTLAGWQIPERFPYRAAFGWEPPTHFLARAVPVYNALEFLNRQEKGRAKVLAIGNELRLYTSAQLEGNFGNVALGQLLSTNADDRLADALRARGYQYLLINWTQVRVLPGIGALPVLRADFLARYARLEFARHDIEVYRLWPPTSLPDGAVTKNLLSNAGFETLGADHLPAGWSAYGAPLIAQNTQTAHAGTDAVRADQASGLFTQVAIEPGRVYTIGHWSRADEANQFARLQVNWLDAAGQLVDVSIEPVLAGPDWTWHQLTASAPERAVTACVYVSVHAKSAVWFDDYLFVGGQFTGALRTP